MEGMGGWMEVVEEVEANGKLDFLCSWWTRIREGWEEGKGKDGKDMWMDGVGCSSAHGGRRKREVRVLMFLMDRFLSCGDVEESRKGKGKGWKR